MWGESVSKRSSHLSYVLHCICTYVEFTTGIMHNNWRKFRNACLARVTKVHIQTVWSVHMIPKYKHILRFSINCFSCLAIWSTWADTSLCSKSCATGTKNQIRDCYRDNQIIDLSNCNGNNTRETECNPQRCRKLTLHFLSVTY